MRPSLGSDIAQEDVDTRIYRLSAWRPLAKKRTLKMRSQLSAASSSNPPENLIAHVIPGT